MRAAIVDTGPLVAFLDRAEHHHRWVAERVEELDTPLLVCEPVLAETMHLLARFSRAQDALFGLLEMVRARSHSALTSISPPCASCIRNIGTGRCRSPMRVLCGWPKSLRARRADTRFRFLSLSQTWPSSTRADSSGGEVGDLVERERQHLNNTDRREVVALLLIEIQNENACRPPCHAPARWCGLG
jgi:hypothetical protein